MSHRVTETHRKIKFESDNFGDMCDFSAHSGFFFKPLKISASLRLRGEKLDFFH